MSSFCILDLSVEAHCTLYIMVIIVENRIGEPGSSPNETVCVLLQTNK